MVVSCYIAHVAMHRTPIPTGNLPHFYHHVFLGWWGQKGYDDHISGNYQYYQHYWQFMAGISHLHVMYVIMPVKSVYFW